MLPDEDEKALANLRAKDLFGNLLIGWSDQNQTLTDMMGLPLSRAEAKAMRSLINQHLKKSPAELAAVANQWLKREVPRGEPFGPERFE